MSKNSLILLEHFGLEYVMYLKKGPSWIKIEKWDIYAIDRTQMSLCVYYTILLSIREIVAFESSALFTIQKQKNNTATRWCLSSTGKLSFEVSSSNSLTGCDTTSKV